MKKDLIKSFLVYGLGDAFSKLVPFILLPFFTEVLLPAEYGVLEVINTIVLILAVLGRVQLDTSLQRFFYEEEKQNELVSTIFWTIVYLSLILGITCFLFSDQLSEIIFKTTEHSFVIKMACIVVLFVNINSYFSIICRYLNMPLYFTFITFFGVLLNGLLSLYLVYFLKIGLIGILYGQILGFVTTSCLFMILCRKYIKFNFTKSIFNKALKFSIPSFPAAILAVFNMHINKFVMLYFLTSASIGVYSIALNLGSGVNIIVGAFSLVWYPFMYKNYKETSGKKLIHDIYYLACFVIMNIIIVISCFVEDLLPFLIKNTAYHDSFYLVAAVALCFFYRIIKYILDSSMLIEKKTIYITYQYIVTLFINILFLFLLIEAFQLIGVIIALVLATITSILMSFYFMKKMKIFSFKGNVLFLTMLCSTVVVFLNLLCDFDLLYRILFVLSSVLISFLVIKGSYKMSLGNLIFFNKVRK
ncbi:oligosaccharide flippase family protein [Flavobacteriaceae bacterium]|nr:oligosaccharide flippase family protein [Flavobacteriaceae bacterium]